MKASSWIALGGAAALGAGCIPLLHPFYTEKNPDAIAHEVVDDRPILTASTEELQKFWVNHLETKDAFGGPCSMTKKEEDAGPQPKEATPSE
jgi:hypothetical protein